MAGKNFNRYRYANNNPYTFVDPDGREAACISAGVNCFDSGGTLGEKAAALAGLGGSLLTAMTGGTWIAGRLIANPAAIQNATVIVGDIAAGDALGGASIGAAAAALKLSGSAHEMFTSARNLIADSAASAAEKVKAFDGLSARITKESGGTLSAAKAPGADGSTIYSGGGSSGGSNMLIIDPNGKVFTGKMTSETLPASQLPNYEKLREH